SRGSVETRPTGTRRAKREPSRSLRCSFGGSFQDPPRSARSATRTVVDESSLLDESTEVDEPAKRAAKLRESASPQIRVRSRASHMVGGVAGRASFRFAKHWVGLSGGFVVGSFRGVKLACS